MLVQAETHARKRILARMKDLESITEEISSLYYGDDAELEQLIIHVLAQLPEEVQEFVCDRCRFLSIGRTANAAMVGGRMIFPHPLHFPEGIKWAIEQGKIEDLLLNPPLLILLSEQIVDKYGPEDVQSIIAHEVAHAILGHTPRHLGMDEVNQAVDIEVEACELASRWGFSGEGTDTEKRAAYLPSWKM